MVTEGTYPQSFGGVSVAGRGRRAPVTVAMRRSA